MYNIALNKQNILVNFRVFYFIISEVVMSGIIVDLNKMPILEYAHVFFKIPSCEEGLGSIGLNKIETRFKCVLSFLTTSPNNRDLEHQAAFYRAALSELVSIEDLIGIELERLGHAGISSLKIHKTNDPLIILLKELRNYELHIGTNKISQESHPVMWGNGEDWEAPPSKNWSFDFIDNLSWSEFSQLHNIKRIEDTSDLEKAFDVFDFQQKHWGIAEMIYRGSLAYHDYLYEKLKNKL